ncbi:cyclase family protein [Desulfoferula mesophila]
MDEGLKHLITKGVVYDLGQPLYPGIPHHPLHPPFGYVMARQHGDVIFKEGASSANDLFTLGGHTGTHLDAVGHISQDGKLFGGVDAKSVQDWRYGLGQCGINETAPIVARAVLFDVPGWKRVDVLDKGQAISGEDLEKTLGWEGQEIKQGDVALIRTGWGKYWDDPESFNSHEGTPGINLDAAQFLVEKGVRFVAADTTACEVVPSQTMEVHSFLLAQNGVQIMEMLNLEVLAKEKAYASFFVAIPLPISGASGSPIRPIAIV